MASRDRWPELCKLVEKDDGLPTRKVRFWSEDKLYFWNTYIHITTSSMVGRDEWSAGLVYVDLFAGPGICTLRDTKRRIPGSPLIAANAPKPFSRILICEKDPELAVACEKRLAASPAARQCRVLCGDCNEHVGTIARAIPDRALTLAFIDPTGLHAKFDTIATLARRGRVDLLVLFADNYDIVRNVDQYEQQELSQLDETLGPDSNWRDKWHEPANRTPTNVRKMFSEIYQSQLRRHLGYQQFGEHVIRSERAPLYRLVYASKHARGLDFWKKATKKHPSGQLGLFD